MTCLSLTVLKLLTIFYYKGKLASCQNTLCHVTRRSGVNFDPIFEFLVSAFPINGLTSIELSRRIKKLAYSAHVKAIG